MSQLIASVLQDPPSIQGLSLAQWDILVRQARTADLLSRVAALIEQAGYTSAVPAAPLRHLRAARLLDERQQREIREEVKYIDRALLPIGVRTILLKGTAYHMAGLPAALGRNFSDIDILVPRAKLAEVESQLMLHGWATTCDNAYDQQYYRKWMHELPPFRHIRRGTAIDVHHNILPDTARCSPDAQKLLESAVPVTGADGVFVLSRTDMVLHSMTHLFHNEEFSHGLRDLSDIDMLLRHFGTDSAYWHLLVTRAFDLGLKQPLSYGLRYSSQILGTPVPDHVLSLCNKPFAWMDGIWRRALCSPHWTASNADTPVSLFFLYLRAHWLRMPLPLLAYHLSVKSIRRLTEKEE
jgi:hypothetical protein